MESRLHLVLERLSNLLREDLREVATAHDLKLVQLSALQYLAAANRFSDTLTDLVAFLGATKGTTSQTVKALERKGLVARTRDADDGRVSHLQLTDAGRALATRGLPAPVLAQIDPDPQLAAAVEGLLRQMLAARGGVAFGVCRTCRHHEARGEGAWCGLLQTALTERDADKWCREHAA